MFKITETSVDSSILPARLQNLVKVLFNEYLPSGKSIKKSIKSGAIRVNNDLSTTGYWVQPKDIISLWDLELNPPKPFHTKLDVLYIDDHVAIINKPPGVTVSGNQFRTIQNMLVYNIPRSTCKDALAWCRPVHRLDNETRGLLLVARSISALVKLGQAFETNQIQKEYHAVVIGKTPADGEIKFEIEDKTAHTSYKLVRTFNSQRNKHLSLIKIILHTGRTHQIRIHFSKSGHPVLGDKLYSNNHKILKHKGLFLASTKLSFLHPVTEQMIEVEIPVPEKFTKYLNREAQRWGMYSN